MKNKGILCLILCLILLIQTVPVFAEPAAGEDMSIQSGSHTIAGQSPILGKEQIVKNAQSALLYETTSDTIMYAWDADKQLPPASLVKIMTALLVLEKCEITDGVKVTASALSSVSSGAVTAELQVDEELTVENLLYCMLVNSANDAASVLAEHASGSQDAFVEEMNRKAQELGCTNTVFTNAHGLHDDRQVTTARDVGRILTEAIKSEEFCKIFGTVHYTVPPTNKSEERKLETGNFLMNRDNMEIYYDGRVTGGRTGLTNKGDRCIASTSEKDGLKFICIIMGSASEYEEEGRKLKSFGGFPETKKLLDLGFDGYKTAQVLYENQAIEQYPVSDGSSDVVLCPKISVSTVLPAKAGIEDLEFRFQNTEGLSAPLAKDQKAGTVQVWYQGICAAQAELYTLNSVKTQALAPAESKTQQSHAGAAILLGVVAIAGLGAISILLMRFYNKHKHLEQHRRNRKNRRRSR